MERKWIIGLMDNLDALLFFGNFQSFETHLNRLDQRKIILRFCSLLIIISILIFSQWKIFWNLEILPWNANVNYIISL